MLLRKVKISWTPPVFPSRLAGRLCMLQPRRFFRNQFARGGMDRRTFISNFAALSAFALSAEPAGVMARERLTTAEQWMDRWMSVDRAPGGLLQISRFKEPIY